MTSQRSILKQKKFWLTLAFSAVCLYFFIAKVDWPSLWEETRTLLSDPRAMIFFVVPSICLNLLSVLVRAFRWRSLLGEPWIPTKRLFVYLSIGFMCNNTLPARIGEVVRTYLTSSRESRRFTSVVATVVVERIFDSAVILFLLGFILVFIPFPETANVGGEEIVQIKTLGAGALVFGACLAGFLALLAYLPVQARRLVERVLRPAPARFTEKIGGLLDSFTEGLSTFKRPSSALWSIFLTFALWLVIGFSEYLIIIAFGIEGVPFSAALVIMVAICIFVALPQAPGYLGVYQLACLGITTQVYGVPEGVAGAFTILLWATQIIPIAIMGLICLAYAGLRFRDITSQAAPETPPQAS